MEENNKTNENSTAAIKTSDSETTTATPTGSQPVSAFGQPASDTANQTSAFGQSASDTTNQTSAFGQPASNTANQASAFGTPTTNTHDASSTASTTNTPATSYYTGSGSNTSANTNSYSYNDTIVTTTDTTSTGFGIASLVMGIISIVTSCCCGSGIIFSILGIIFGCIQQKDAFGKKPGTAIAGIITSCVGIVFCIIALCYYLLVGAAASAPDYF